VALSHLADRGGGGWGKAHDLSARGFCCADLMFLPPPTGHGGVGCGASSNGALGASEWRGFAAVAAHRHDTYRLCFFGFCDASMVEVFAGSHEGEPPLSALQVPLSPPAHS
jgi:hypothetical protein